MAINPNHKGFKLGRLLASRGVKLREFKKRLTVGRGWSYQVSFKVPKEPVQTEPWAHGEIVKHTTNDPELLAIDLRLKETKPKHYEKYLAVTSKVPQPLEFLEHFAAGLKTKRPTRRD